MQDAEYFPRYMAHQLRTHLSATVVGRLVEVNEQRHSVMIETDPDGTHLAIQPKCWSRDFWDKARISLVLE
jgi:hypothetical protein